MVTKNAASAADREAIIQLLTEGGDERITIDPQTGLNRYLCTPRPSDVLAFSSTTANDLSADALLHLAGLPLLPASPADYADRLEALRKRIRSVFGVDGSTAVILSPSGTDLEYIALACALRGDRQAVTNLLLGADEVGSGCIHSANGRHFALTTPIGVATTPGAPVEGMTGISIVDIPVRDEQGRPRPSAEIAEAIDGAVRAARAQDRHVLAHVVHGSKTGLVIPAPADLDRLRAQWGDAITWVIDACQTRITPAAVQAYLERGAIVLLTGSKFVGAPPFSGFALVPPTLMAAAEPLKPGLGTIFRRAEWPSAWPGVERLTEGMNPGLLLRLEAALFEMERYHGLDGVRVRAITDAFAAAVRRMVERLGIALIPEGTIDADGGPELNTIFALDLSNLAEGADFEAATRWYRRLAERGIRLGQPVRCAKLADGRWSATLRLALSMPMIVERAADCAGAEARFDKELARIAAALTECAGMPAPAKQGTSIAA